MLLAVQRYVEDLLEQRGLRDIDQYALKVSNLYAAARSGTPPIQFLGRLHSVRTSFFRINKLERSGFEERLLNRLDRQFFRLLIQLPADFPDRPARQRQQRAGRRSIKGLLENFKQSVEANTVDMFWESRVEGRLRPQPEELAQGLLATFADRIIDGHGWLVQQFSSGIGYVDVGISFGTTLHLVELKIYQGGEVIGPGQLAEYMRNKRRRYGWLVMFDGRPPSSKGKLPDRIQRPEGEVRIVIVDINPAPPSSLR